MRSDLLILGEYDPDSETHRATDVAIRHSLVRLRAKLTVSWISTETIEEVDIVQAHGLWVAPGSPYKDLSRTLQAIRLARENLLPCLGTCGGFQHMVLEFARNVLGFADARHAEYDPDASRLFISALSCAVVGKELRVRLQPHTTAHTLYGRDEIRIIEIRDHPFFLGTLFVPQTKSSESVPHPLVSGFIQAVLRHRTP